ncbi:hypothetical protein Q3G72_000349 [Acer saccharum]|nr:hypothetical protein Q3G72_000349 [Acer saccharum]
MTYRWSKCFMIPLGCFVHFPFRLFLHALGEVSWRCKSSTSQGQEIHGLPVPRSVKADWDRLNTADSNSIAEAKRLGKLMILHLRGSRNFDVCHFGVCARINRVIEGFDSGILMNQRN